MSRLPARRNAEIDRLRAVAVLLVIFVHLPSYLFFGRLSWPYPFSASWSGVELFFVISGFVVSGVLAPKIDRITTGSRRKSFAIQGFYIRRLFRLLPACVLWLVIVLVCSVGFNRTGLFGVTAQLWKESFLVLAYCYNFFWMVTTEPYKLGWHWSLSVEEQFYILYPLVLLVAKTRKSRIRLAVVYLLVISFVVRPFVSDGRGMEGAWFRYFSPVKFDCIMAGAALYFFSRGPGYQKFRHKLMARQSLAIGLALLMIVLLASAPQLFEAEPLVGYPVILLASSTLVFLASLEKGLVLPLGRPLNTVLDWVGTRSYTLYLAHVPVIWLILEASERLGQPELSPWMLFLIFAVVLVMLTEATYSWVEAPFVRLGHRVTHKMDSRAK